MACRAVVAAPITPFGKRVRAAVRRPDRTRRLRVNAFVEQDVFDVRVRPYTTRKGDSLESIAKKRDLTVEQVLIMNPNFRDQEIVEGTTILLPGDKLSTRDKEILNGVNLTGYRIYPVRNGETIDDIIGKRGITLDEMRQLNPGINFSKLTEMQLLKLPEGKFTVREREMLLGTGILPPEFFAVTKDPLFIGFSIVLFVCGFIISWMKFYKEPEDEKDLPEDLANKVLQ